ncbi:uncharacterized protein Z518_05419 [Rhinocladiella mackenziei CBS 650.93]|uniref:Fungal N-terminal domain-containing protein n=1 Tax=Rhinocladiella mackenziei CBS 650.93 TaxID=1442369 RepID=A0A0D2IFG7_9EURO|nr:uncharacterized protein Z518_05419 [Rhinocladiella mackenziei CBS 650.93]KIX04549.1 hypothetical protein Z518_05419 [Rhinocladiella mackenziei CBS 650.93]
MAEIGIIASIVGVAGAGFKLSLILNAISCEVANAGLEVHSISKTVTLFSLMLKQTGNVLQSADSVHSREAVETVKSMADESTRVFDEINDMLDRVRTKPTTEGTSPTIQQRFRWCFKKHRVIYLLAQLESLKLSLSLMLQIIQLGKLMASTSRRDLPEEVAIKTEAIKQERAEAQNGVIVRYWQMSTMDRLFEASQKEDEEERQAIVNNETVQDDHLSMIATDSSQVSVEVPPPEYAPSTALAKLPVFSLGELDQTLHQMKGSPKDMIRVSNQAIDPLLERWTLWREVRERRHNRDVGGRFAPSVQNLNEDDEDRPFHERYREREDSPRGYYLEGNTTDWRKPNSASARYEAFRRRKEYSNYQPSVSAASSDVEDSPGSASSKKRRSKRHIIDSGSESSASEPDLAQPKPRRRSSGSPTAGRKIPFSEGAPVAHTYTAPAQPPPWMIAQTTPGSGRAPSVTSAQSTASRLSSPAFHPPGHRPWAAPDQSLGHHSQSSPLPPIHTANSLNPYAPPQHHVGFPRYVGQPQAQPSPYGPPSPQSRYMSQPSTRMGPPPRPLSQDGKPARSPSRLSQYGTPPRSHTGRDDEKRHSREKTTKQNLREGATKGLLGTGAIAGFLEALEGLSL